MFKSGDPSAIAAANVILKTLDIPCRPFTVTDAGGIRCPQRSQVIYVPAEHETAARDALNDIPTEFIMPHHEDEARNRRERIIIWFQLGIIALIILFSIIMNIIRG